MRVLAALLLATAVWAQETPLEAGERKLEAEDYEGAVADFGKAIEGAPGDARGYAGRARALQMLDRDADAIKDFSKAIELAPKWDARYHVQRAVSYWMIDDYDAAIADCSRAIEIDPRYAFAYRMRGDALRGKREDAAAVADFDKALEVDPRDFAALRSRGETKAALRDFDGAIKDFTQLTRLDSDSPVPFALRGYTMLRIGDYEGALKDFEAAFYTEDPEDPDRGLHVACARAHLALGHKEKAEVELAKAAEPPGDADAFAERGRYYLDADRPKEAAADLSKAVEMDPEGQDYSRLYLFLARARLGERPLAAGGLKTYVDAREKRDDWYAQVAGFLFGRLKEEDFFEAAKSANLQIAIEQECEASWYAGAFRLLDGDAEGARKLFERCVATDVRTFIEYESARMALAATK